ncbi:unnamed protein product [Schistosoma margrebowiei]|uniref:Isochorismatase-like domain-containing protein n=1 Tax=Schistosoma margrebowiei TaxID=48269 RepID=A0A183LFK3_9TREM|nr:unnamed protein product [Schistosoma margrebowiei]
MQVLKYRERGKSSGEIVKHAEMLVGLDHPADLMYKNPGSSYNLLGDLTVNMSNSMLTLDPNCTVFLMCDVQKSLLNTVIDSDNVHLRISHIYSKGLGKTSDSLDISHALCVVDKTSFSMYHGLIAEKLAEFRDRFIVLFGLEAHICILQTALHLLSENYKVVIVADACSSRSAVDMRIALQVSYYIA